MDRKNCHFLARFVLLFCVAIWSTSSLFPSSARATPFTMTSPDGTALPSVYPEAGGIAMILYGANGNIYYQFSDPAGAFVGFQNSGNPVAFRGNPFTINTPLTLDCGVQSCPIYFGGAIVKMEIRFTAGDGDTQVGGFDEDDISLLLNGTNIGNWSDIQTQNTDVSGATLISSQLGYGNQTFDTGWFSTTNATLLADVLTTETLTTQVFDSDPNDNYWNFRTGNSLANPGLAKVAPAYTLDKKARSGSIAGPEITTFSAVGDVIYYTYDVENIGSVLIDNIEVSDDKLGTVSCAPTTINVGESAFCSATHTVTQADYDAQDITNIATVQGDPDFGQLGTFSDTVTLTGPAINPSIEILKTPTGTTFGNAGSNIAYSFAVENDGDVTLTNAVVTDPLLPALSCSVASLAPNATLDCTGNYTVLQSDVDAGSISNTATVNALDPTNTNQSDSDTAVNTSVPNPAFSVIKTTASTPTQVNDTLTYSFALRNDGNITIDTINVVDAKCAATPVLVSGDIDNDTDLDVGETHVYSCTSIAVIQTEIDAGQVNNSVIVTGNPAIGSLAQASDSLSTPIASNPAFTITKSTASTPAAVDDTLLYSFSAVNTGNVTIDNIAVSDAKCAAAPTLVSETVTANGDLDFGETQIWQCTSIAVTQAEVDAGQVDNTASLTGTVPSGATVPSVTDDLTTLITPNAVLNIVKGSVSTPTNAGETLAYTFDLTNGGNVTILNPVVTDAKCATPVTLLSGDTDSDGHLDLGETHQYGCTSIAVTQVEVDAGQVDNTANVSGTLPAGGTIANSDMLSVPIAAAPVLTLDKMLNAASPTSFDTVGQTLLYDFVVTNTGNVTLTNQISITDPLITGAGGSITCPAPPLAPGASLTCTGSYTVDQLDIDNGQVTNTASATDSVTTSNTDGVTVMANQTSGLNVVKVATAPASFANGQTINYTYTVTNTGNVTIPDTATISVNDNRATVTCPAIPVGGLAPVSQVPTANMVCTASYVITPSDISIGTVTNIASATDGTTTSPTDSATVPNSFDPALSITKSATVPSPATYTGAGDTITYSYSVQNTGGVSFSEIITVTDDKINGGAPFNCWVPSGPLDTFDPDPTYVNDGINPPPNTNGETQVCTALYTVTQADVDAGSVTNQAVAETVFAPSGANIPVSSPQDELTVNATEDASLTVAKTASPTDLTTVAAGDVITYTFTIQNTGSTTLSDAVPVDSGPTFGDGPAAGTGVFSGFTVTTGVDGNTDGKADTIAPGASAVFQATYTLTQADIDNAAAAADPSSAIANTASGTAVPANGTLDPVTSDTATTGFTAEPAWTVTKQTASSPANAGDTLSYSFFVENTGNVSISAVSVADAKCTAAPVLQSGDLNTNTILDVSEIWAYSCTSIVVTQDEIDAGQVDNSVTVTGTPTGGTLTNATDDLETPIAFAPSFGVAKTTASVPVNAGSTLVYDFALTNTGNVSIQNVVVADAKCAAAPALQSGDSDNDSGLDPTETWLLNCTSIAVTQAEVDAGQVDNTATLNGQDPNGATVTQVDDSLSTPIAAAPAFSVAKSTASVPAVAGDTLTYSFAVDNDGNVSINNINLSDPKCVAPPAYQSGDTNSDGSLGPSETWNYGCTSLAVTQAEIDAGQVDNTVSLSGNEPDGSVVTPVTDLLQTPVTPNPSWTLAKSTASTPAMAGDTLNYDFLVTNTGNVSITGVSIADAKCAAAPVLTAGTDLLADSVLSPSEAWGFTCTSIAVTQAEIDAGQVDNAALATGMPSGGTLPNAPGSNSTSVASTPGVAVAKSTASVPTQAGDTLLYQFDVTNTGNTSLSSVVVDDAKCATVPALQAGSDANSDSALNPTETWTYTCTSVAITQAEVDAGVVNNDVDVDAQDPIGANAPTGEDSVSTPIASNAAWRVVKSSASTPTIVGDTLVYDFTIHNDGNVSISNIAVSDAKCAAAVTLQSGDTNLDTDLNPTETWVYSCTSIGVTQAEIDAGLIANNVSVAGDDPSGDPLAPATDSNTVGVAPDPSIEAVKTITSVTANVNDTVIFEFAVENTGNVTLTGVGISDTLTRADNTPLTLASGPSFTSADMGSSLGVLLPGETAAYTASYVLLQADIDAGGISNTATVTGIPPTGAPVMDVSDDGTPGNGDDNPTVLTITPNPSLVMVKSLGQINLIGGGTGSSFSSLGDVIDYEFTVTNSGNVTITNQISITDPLITGAGGSISCPVPPLVPTASVTCTGSYTAVQADLDAGQIDNTASATDGTTTSTPDTLTVPGIQNPSMSMTKTAQPIAAIDFIVGASITYDYVVTNDGNTTVTQPIVVTDNLIPAANITCDPWPGTLAPTGTYACVGTYVITADDVDLFSVTNIASGTDGTTTTPPVSETIPDSAVPALTIDKTTSTADYNAVNDALSYSFMITNTGTRALVQPIVVQDDLIGPITCWTPTGGDPDFTAGETATCVGTYDVTQVDLDAGSVTNNAYAETTYGSGTNVVSPPDVVTIDAVRTPSIDLVKSVALPAGKTNADLIPNDVLTYTLGVENTGNLTISNVTVTDALLGLSCTIASLSAGTTDTSCTGTLAITQADIDAGDISNTASAVGSDPFGGTTDDSDTLITPMPVAAPALELTKTANPSPFGAVGTTVVYSFAVENTGNVTISNMTVTDPLIPSLSCSIASLAPNATDTTCSAVYTVTQDNIDDGNIVNTGNVSGQDPSGGAVSDTDMITTNGPAADPSLEVTKTFATTGQLSGAVVTFTVTVENTGNVTLSNVVPSDTLTRVDGTPLTLDAPGLTLTSGDLDTDSQLDVTETWTYIGVYTIDQDDINAGGIRNTVNVVAQDPNTTAVNDVSDDGDDSDGNTTDDPTEFAIFPGPEIGIQKTISAATGLNVGDTVTFEFEVRNLGNVDLNTVVIADTLTRADGTPLSLTTAPTLVSGDVSNLTRLDVDEVWTYQATYILVQLDVDAGGISNSAVANANDPSGSPVNDTSDDGDDADGNTEDDLTELSIPPMPGIEAEKTVTTPANAVGGVIAYQIIVENTGNVTLSSVAANDTLTRADGTVLSLTTGPTFASATMGSLAGSLIPNETATYTATYELVQADIDAGGLSNSVVAVGNAPNGSSVSDTSDDGDNADGNTLDDPTESTFTQSPSLALGKSVESQRNLFPTIYEVTFAITIENDGNTTQTGLQAVDDLVAFAAPATLLSATYPPAITLTGFTTATANPTFDGAGDTNLLAGNPTLAPGETGTIQVTATYATATGDPAPGTNVVSGSSDQTPNPTPADTTIVSNDADGDGVPDGNESPTEDRDGDGIPDDQDYDPTGYFYCEDNGQILSGGQITVSGGGASLTGVGSSGAINIVQDGTSGFYQFYVTAPGTYTLSYTSPTGAAPSTARPATASATDVTTLVDVLAGTTTTNPRVIGSGETGSTGLLADFSVTANPTFYTSFVFEAGDPFIISNNIPFEACTSPSDLLASKTVVGDSSVVIGDLVTYQIDYSLGAATAAIAGVNIQDLMPIGISYVPNSAMLSLNGGSATAVEPVIAGRLLTWSNYTIPVGGSISITLSGRVMPNAPNGQLTNTTYATDASGNQISNRAEAAVERSPEHVFDCSDVIGKVFDDINGDGYQNPPLGIIVEDVFENKVQGATERVQDGEPGLAGVRIATPRGTLITTDEFGRYHVPCAELPADIGANFILKVDERSLPTGYRLTTENPRVERLTAGKLVEMNFGASLTRIIDIDLNGLVFDAGNAPNARLTSALRNLANNLGDEPSVVRLTYLQGASTSLEDARARLRNVETLLRREWRAQGRAYLGVERSIRQTDGGE